MIKWLSVIISVGMIAEPFGLCHAGRQGGACDCRPALEETVLVLILRAGGRKKWREAWGQSRRDKNGQSRISHAVILSGRNLKD